MNCRDIESLILAERDCVLSPEQHTVLSDHVAACPGCGQLRTNLAQAMTALQTETASVTVPDIDAEWRTLRAQLDGTAAKPEQNRRFAPVVWFSAPLAAAAAIAFAFFINRPTPPGFDETDHDGEVASADYVEAGDAEASTMVYVDKESGWLVVWAADEGQIGSG